MIVVPVGGEEKWKDGEEVETEQVVYGRVF
jgi:acetylornithine deacetylase/succinyl-diaminopimelate desuccinylase-like protein